MHKSMIFLAVAAAIACAPAMAQSSTVSVGTDPLAPISNFQSPSNVATAGYTITLNDDGTKLNGSFVQTGGQAAGPFANLYFDLNPTVGDGSDLGFELGLSGADAFIPGKNGQPGFMVTLDPSAYSFTSSTDSSGLITLNLSLDNSLFTGPIAGLAYYDDQTFESTQTLRLSQSLSYSVAGGSSYGANRLGSFSVAGGVPEPATWAMMILGMGAIGLAARRRKVATRVSHFA